jgi:hypothetical protein
MRPLLLVSPLFAALLTGCSNDSPMQPISRTGLRPSMSQAAGSTIDISGAWHIVDHTFLVARYNGAIAHLACVSEGVLNITQNGDAFTGTSVTQSGSCTTQDGEVIPPPWPPQATVTGRISGQAFQTDQYDAPPNYPVHCPGSGTIELSEHQAVGLHMVGRCDLLFTGIRPIMARSYSTATR